MSIREDQIPYALEDEAASLSPQDLQSENNENFQYDIEDARFHIRLHLRLEGGQAVKVL